MRRAMRSYGPRWFSAHFRASSNTLLKVSNIFSRLQVSTMTRSLSECNGNLIVEKASIPYQKLCTEYYELDKPVPPKDGLDFYCRLADEAQGHNILEPMCGSGRFLIPMRERGYNIVGFDTSSHMLEIGRKKCTDKKFAAALIKASFETFNPIHPYGLIFIPSGSICLLTEKERMEQALRSIFGALDKKGKFAFEIDTLSSITKHQEVWQGHWVDKPDGSKLILNTFSRFDPASKINTTLCRYERWEKNHITQTEVEDFRVRLYELEEMEDLLKYHGFKVVNTSVPYTGAKPDKKTECIVIECVKNEC